MTDQPDGLEGIRAEIAELTDLFRRRLAEDKTKQRQLEELYSQLEFARQALAGALVIPLVRETLLIADRVDISGEVDPLTESVVDEMLEIYKTRGLRAIAADSSFDASMHEAVEAEVVTESELVGQVLAVRRVGYSFGGTVVRPAQVVVGTAAPNDTESLEPESSVDGAPASLMDERESVLSTETPEDDSEQL